MVDFATRVASLPRLGVGLSQEFGASATGIDPREFQAAHPGLLHFVEYGGDLDRGVDEAMRAWVREGGPATWHFLDINLEEGEDLTRGWARKTAALAEELRAPWLCGDGGLWHWGRRERGQGLLLPPILTADSAQEMGETVARLQAWSGLPVLPENPPAAIYLGNLHILEYFSRVAELADGGLLLDCAHLAIFQASRNLPLLAGVEDLAVDRVVEIHVAGGTVRNHQGFSYIDDDHGPEPLPQTWALLEHLLPRCKNLKAVVYECERNPPQECVENFIRLNRLFPASLDAR